MSVKYIDKDGNIINASGLTPGGNLEAGAVMTRTGQVSVIGPSSFNSTLDTVVTFSEPLPDADYIVDISSNGADLSFTVLLKTASGFRLRTGLSSNDGAGKTATVTYTATKTYTVQHAAQNAADIAAIKSAIPTGAGSSNKLVTTTQFNNAVNPLTESIADIQDAVPADASITNKLVSQETLDNELEEADEDIWKAMGKNSAKNLLPYPYTNTNRAVNNVTYIDNKDGTITVNGTASATTAFGLLRNINDNRFAGMRLSGGVNENLYVRARIGDKETDTYIAQVIDTGDGCIIPEIDVNTQVIRFEYIITNGTTADHITLYPMIYLASDIDNTWKPYTKTNQELSKEQYTINMNNVLGVKNILEYPYYDTTKHSGNLYFTDLGDGTININGSHTTVVWFWIILDGNIKKGTYRLSSNIPLPTGVRLALLNHLSSDTYYANIAEGDTEHYFEIPEDINGTIRAGIRIEKDTQVNNINIRPMLRLGDDNDNTWQPYALTNQQLTQNKISYTDNGILGAKNLLPNRGSGTTATSYGVTFTIQDDGSVIANGTATGGQAIFQVHFKVPLKKGIPYIISGGISTSKFAYVNAINNNSYVKTIGLSVGDHSSQYDMNPFTPDYVGYTHLEIGVAINDGVTCNNDRFYPMIRLASDPDETYQPYAMTNQELSKIQTKTYTANTTYIDTTQFITVRKVGPLVVLSFNASFKADLPNATTILLTDLPKPSVQTHSNLVSNDGLCFRTYINEAGQFVADSISGGIVTTNKWFAGQVVYFTTES